MKEIPSDIYVRCYNQLKRIEKDHQKLPKREYPKKCYWYWGDPRTGKTRKAREEEHYVKRASKWWDGYDGDKRVVIDDIGPERAKILTEDLKLWADPWYNQPGETKGGQCNLTYDELYVTSNYPLESFATGPCLEALRARFEVIHFNKGL